MGRRASLVAGAFVSAAALLLSGCSDGTSSANSEATQGGAPTSHSTTSGTKTNADLDAYVATVQQGMKTAVGPSIRKLYSSMRVEPVYPNGIKYIYVFKNQLDVSQGAKALAGQAPVLKAAFRTQVAPEMKRLGFDHPSATWTYLNPDGTQIYTLTTS
jgi:hypothetical protein